MSILIKGMKMPKSCEDCDLCTSDGYCMATGGDSLWDALPKEATFFPDDWKYEGCSLVEIPEPHGRLIDADRATAESIKRTGKRLLAIDTAPTIIEAEGSENE